MLPLPKDSDSLPKFPEPDDWWYEQPRAIRHFQEENKLLSALDGTDFLPVPGKPGMERNSKGHLRYIPDMRLLGPRHGSRKFPPCNSEGWISHIPGHPQPCPDDTPVEVKTRDEIDTGVYSKSKKPASDWCWSKFSPHEEWADILLWKPVL